MTTILVVEDDRTLSDALTYNLRREGYTPIAAPDAPSAIRLARHEHPELILLDLMLPGGNGFDVCRSIREFSKAPIIILTARGEDVDRVLGLEIGADDYVTKPFSLRELLARVRANLRRLTFDRDEESEDEVVAYGPLRIDVAARRAEIESTSLNLQPKEFDLLLYFARNPGVVLTRARLLATVWGHDFVGERTVDVHVRRLRAKLAKSRASDVIRTVHSVGYVFGASQRAAAGVGAEVTADS